MKDNETEPTSDLSDRFTKGLEELRQLLRDSVELNRVLTRKNLELHQRVALLEKTLGIGE